MTTTFTPDIIDSYAKLQNFLVGPEADARVLQQLRDTEPKEFGSTSKCYALFLTVMGVLLQSMGYKQQGLAWEVRAEAIMNRIRENRWFGKDCISPSINKYSEEALDKLYPLGTISVETISDPGLRAINQARKVLDFQDTRGFCLGESYWFIRAYLKTQAFFATHRQHVEALGKLFKNGAPTEAALIQKVCRRHWFLQLKDTQTIELTNLQPSEQPLSQEKLTELINTFRNLEPGAYAVEAPMHEMAYISNGQGTGYFFDPTYGIVYIHNDEGLGKMADHIACYQEMRSEFVAAIAEQSKKYANELLVAIYKMELQ